ncbi:protein of unknown function [Candidatus Nitrosotalea okcheonensis]|uniref:Uncharacterized protein n=1 Tax=Candidatus Nitrosotalea okcheonensis TaxID=1903276 RepID=A0A2H1FHQ0_9ARCH|nr:protein of unknown function [Candidatus Nitrosotalea okcheonensis]
MLDQGKGMGDIDHVYDHEISKNETILLNDSSVIISGWIMRDMMVKWTKSFYL